MGGNLREERDNGDGRSKDRRMANEFRVVLLTASTMDKVCGDDATCNSKSGVGETTKASSRATDPTASATGRRFDAVTGGAALH